MRRSESLADRAYRLMLRLFPAEFRGDFGAEMADDFRDQRREAFRKRGTRGLAGLWLSTLGDIVRTAPCEQAETLWADVRYAFRMMRRFAMGTAVLVVLLAVGIGANIAVFGIADPLVRRPLPVPAGRDLVRIVDTGEDGAKIFSHPAYLDIRDRSRAFDGVAAHQYTNVSFGTGDGVVTIGGEVVSGNYFDVYGVRPALGRLLRSDDDVEVGGSPVAVISHALWRDRFGSAPDIVGRVLHLNGHPLEIVGVAPATFPGSYAAFASQFWAPITMYRQVRPQNLQLTQRGWGWLSLTARLKPGLPLAQADSDLGRIGLELYREYPRASGRPDLRAVRASGLPEGTRAQAAGVLTFATVIAALVLLVTCANIAGVLQSRAVARTRETSIRYALGASRFRVVRQWLTESVCLAIMGAAAGLVVQQALRTTLTGVLRAAAPQQLASLPVADIRTLLFTFAVAIASGMAFGLLPALRSARGEAALRETSAAILGRRAGARGTRLLVALQVAVCLGLLITAGLLARSLRNSTTFDPGFDGSGLVVARVDLRRLGYDVGRGRVFHDALAARLGERPEVRAISRATVVPLGGDQERLGMRIAGHTASSGSPVIPIDVNAVGPDYFSALEIPLVRGRGISSADGPRGRPVVVINETMAKRYWPSADPIGQTITLAGRSPVDLEVIGVAKDIKYYSLDEAPRPYAYLAADQSGGYGGAVLHVRVTGDPGRFVSTLRREAALVDPAVSLDQAMSFDELRQQPLALRRTISVLASVFGAIALLLAAVGIYGTMSQVVGQRTREIGVRMAFGARVEDIFRLVVGQGMRPVLAGLVLGIGAAAGISRLVASELFGVTPADPLTHAMAIAAVLIAALVALALPARRATRVDPVTTLRST